MSVAAMTAVWKHSRATTPSELLVLLALADWADDDGYCFPSHRAIAQKTRTSRATVKRVMRLACDRGELARVKAAGHTAPTPREFVGGTGFHPTNLYQLAINPTSEQGSVRAGLNSNPAQSDTGLISTRELGSNALAHKRKYTSEDPVESTHARAGHRRHAFCPPNGDGFCVPGFLHQEFDAMLGLHGPEFNLLAWYVETDQHRRQEQPTVGDPLAWWRDGLRAEMQRRGWLVPRSVLPDRRLMPPPWRPSPPAEAYPWVCPHDPPCPHRAACAVVAARPTKAAAI